MSQNYEYDQKTNSYIPIDEKKGNDEEKIVAIVLWALQFLSSMFWPIFITVLAFLYYRDKSPYLKRTIIEILNFEISFIIYLGVSVALSFILIGLPLLLVVVAFNIVIPILGILNAADNKLFRVPYIFRFVTD